MSPTPVGLAAAADGTLLHALPFPAEALPVVAPARLREAWDAARIAATAEAEGPPRALLFRGTDGATHDLLIADSDARCWAMAVDHLAGLDTTAGIALLMRLLALVDLLARVRFLDPMFAVSAGGTEFHPALLDAAARQPLDAAGRFDAAAWKRLFSDRLESPAPRRAQPHPGVA
ncbi:hypothetical protein C8P66_101261 [Humitalea rosea]|uniref:Uncharacterized protein n=1 Tax=Humitalea rosea TaxID=990373 RepID=A0A2W7IU54_9PROT|nr:hypothetical protein [Humitalea rosea]PZW51044.1 hypothetical protein C8P66_101261 [Humitalea rosea]